MTAHMDDNGASLQPIDDTPAFSFYRYAMVCFTVAAIIALAACQAEAVLA